jgi:hypothetical protein
MKGASSLDIETTMPAMGRGKPLASYDGIEFRHPG